jgi:L-threonylcarbamoyladenylate synthase
VRGGAAAYARELFAALRAAESAGVGTLYVESVPDRGVGRAVMDRLRRAAAR